MAVGTAIGGGFWFSPQKIGVFRTPSIWTSIPCGADVGSHPGCQATAFQVYAKLDRVVVWINTLLRFNLRLKRQQQEQ